jgi:hypothetical protein
MFRVVLADCKTAGGNSRIMIRAMDRILFIFFLMIDVYGKDQPAEPIPETQCNELWFGRCEMQNPGGTGV